MNRLYPIFLNLEGRLCAVVGGGAVAARKVENLVECGARVRVIAPKAVHQIERMTLEGHIEWIKRVFTPTDIVGLVIIISATDDPDVNRAVCGEARARGVLCNVVDQPDLCDFHAPAIARRGDLAIAVSTNGRAPELGKAIRSLLERRAASEEFARAVEEAGRLRDALRLRLPNDGSERRRLLRETMRAEELVEAIDRGDRERAQAIIDSWKSFLSE